MGMEGDEICMNGACGTASAGEWKQGWPLRSGGHARLCNDCGSAYENSSFCDIFHRDESGWRRCNSCSKQLHCGCIASKSLLELMDFGGVICLNCSKSQPTQSNLIKVGGHIENCMQLDKSIVQLKRLPQTQEVDFHVTVQEEENRMKEPSTRENIVQSPNSNQPLIGPSMPLKADEGKLLLKPKEIDRSFLHPSSCSSFRTSTQNSTAALPICGDVGEGSEMQTERASMQQEPRFHQAHAKVPKSANAGLETSKVMVSQVRVARRPAEGRGKNQLLPRYWPRITDQELQKLSGDLKSTVVPLFEKVLSASDAGRIGRLVLPKACAEAYFPQISQSEGIPLMIQDVMGKEWTFQFRYWPNNNSRMYVLEGVTPCIQSMQLQAGDTVTFSRINPGVKLVMGFRKASNSGDAQDNFSSVSSAGPSARKTSFSTFSGKFPTAHGCSDLLSMRNFSGDQCLEPLSKVTLFQDLNSCGYEKNICSESGDSSQNFMEKKARNIGSKSRRLLMHSEDALELRLTWEEAQDLLRPPPSVSPSIVTVEGHIFEEYDAPPVFGDRTSRFTQPSGGKQQLVQCDDYLKWQRLPVDVVLPAKWTGSENLMDSERRFCSMPDESSPHDLDGFSEVRKDVERQTDEDSHGDGVNNEICGLDALASAAVLGESMVEPGETSASATTRHPRHRTGCTCIVCIQPPSGKGKHKPTCACIVCMTVKRRRFRTVMLRKRKQQSEPETETNESNGDVGIYGSVMNPLSDMKHADGEDSSLMFQAKVVGHSNAQIDLNSHPKRENVEPEEHRPCDMRLPSPPEPEPSSADCSTAILIQTEDPVIQSMHLTGQS